MSARGGALVAFLVLAVALMVSVVGTTPGPTPGGNSPRQSAARPGTPVVPAGAQGAEIPTQDFSAAEVAREDAFHSAVRPPAYASLLLGLVLALLLGLTPLGARLVGALASPLGDGWAWRVLAGGVVLPLAGWLATLPLDVRAEVVLRRYGLSTQTWASWFADRAKGLGLSVGLLLLVLFAGYALMRAFPRGWWLPGALGAAALVVAVSFLFPLVVEPVFNSFTPLSAGPLRDSLTSLAERDAVPVRDVLVADASRRTTALNAYVSGFGSTRRIVVYDTLLSGAREDEVRLIVAHELGHAKSKDVLRGTLVGALGAAAAVCLLYLAATSPDLLRRADVSSPADPRSCALLLAIAAVLATLGGPAQMLVSRRIEARADLHALELTRAPETFAAMQRRLAVRNLSDLDPPWPVYLLFASHPTAPQRIALARSWARDAGLPEPGPLAP